MRRMRPTEVRAVAALFGNVEGSTELATRILRLVNEMRDKEKVWVVQVGTADRTSAVWGPFGTAKAAREAVTSGRINAVAKEGASARLWVLVDAETDGVEDETDG